MWVVNLDVVIGLVAEDIDVLDGLQLYLEETFFATFVRLLTRLFLKYSLLFQFRRFLLVLTLERMLEGCSDIGWQRVLSFRRSYRLQLFSINLEALIKTGSNKIVYFLRFDTFL